LATELEDTDPDAAIPLYERALVVGMYPFYLKTDDDAAKRSFGNALWNLANLYEAKGYEDQLISLYRESFDLLSTNYQAGDASSYIGLYSLASYYGQQNRYAEAISTINEVLAYIEAHRGIIAPGISMHCICKLHFMHEVETRKELLANIKR